ncbi:hypothetical protein QQF64_019169 [Cirrhinus molitorella]|uniref:Glutathione peroxidase 4 n=1 Tax=Cirrhinus molitorella TaxID=172907 RepID=A0ABR3LIQ9_9TELE
MAFIYRFLLFGALSSSGIIGAMSAQLEDWKSAKSIYEFSATDIDGNEVSLEKYRGEVVIITNVASK